MTTLPELHVPAVALVMTPIDPRTPFDIVAEWNDPSRVTGHLVDSLALPIDSAE
jgi:hypothetical protein